MCFQSAVVRFAAAALFFAVCMGAASSARASWQLAWSDEFDGTNVNSANWTYDTGNGAGGWGNNELEYYTTRTNNVFVTNGLLHIVARKESYQGFNYTSAKLKTLGLFSTTYGRFEFRAKLPQGVGYWPALWLMPVNNTYGGWAASGEVDIMENKGRYPTNVLGTLHFGAPYPGQDQSHGPSYNFPTGDSVTNFHTYVLEWTTNQFNWYVDSTLYETQTSWWTSGGTYPEPFNIPFYIIMNLAVGGNFDGNPDATTVFPGDMQLDYVRVYNWVTPSAPVLQLRLPFNDAPGASTTPSDTNGGGANVTLQMTAGNGAPLDCHGAAGSGVAGANNNSRALDFTSNGTNQPGMPGPLAAGTNSALGFGTVSNFIVSCWFKQSALMANGANIGPRLFVLGGGMPNDTGVANSIGLKFQTATQLYFQLGSAITLPFSIPSQTNDWIYFAAMYDGSTLSLYTGTDGAVSSLKTNLIVSTSVQFGSAGSLYIGNRQDWQRSFDGLIDDFRFYTGASDSTFVENIRLLAARPPWGLAASATNSQIALTWGTALGATSYNVKRSLTSGGPYTNIGTGVTTTSFTDTNAANGPTYYYVVSTVNPAGEGATSAEVSASLSCMPAPSAGNNGPVAAGNTLSLTASAIDGASYAWTGPNGFTSTDQNPSIANTTTNASGIYSVTATVGACNASAQTSVIINPGLSQLQVLSSDNGLTLNWQNGTLQSSTNLDGPWEDVPNAAPPSYSWIFTEPQRFFRLR